jgi:para-aminobenzoate synthetase
MSGSTPPGPSWGVRPATHEDVPAVAAAVRNLLHELGGPSPVTFMMSKAAQTLIDNPQAGVLLVAQLDGETAASDEDIPIVGVLGVSWQIAIHVPGRYALIQDLWVDPKWRGKAVGGDLLTALFERASELEITRVEVGLPRESYSGFAATRAFYLDSGFMPLGARMRRGLP